MFRKFIVICIAMFAILTAAPASSVSGNSNLHTGSFGNLFQSRFGPYATLRRANEVAAYARSKGYRAKVGYAGSIIYGTRSYYVDVW